MTDIIITVYRAGTFSTEPAPSWLHAIHAAADELEDWNEALSKVLRRYCATTAITQGEFEYGRVTTWVTPDRGIYVEMDSCDRGHAEVWLPEPADWLPFSTTHVEPFLQTRAALQHNGAIERLANALIAFMRHGEGKHIDRLTGESRIDQQADWKERTRSKASAPPLTATTSSPIS